MQNALSFVLKNSGGTCNWVYQHYGSVVATPGFADVPEMWLGLYSEYISWLDRAIEALAPLYNLCRSGGGTMAEESVRQISGFIDEAQNRLYQLWQEANAMR